MKKKRAKEEKKKEKSPKFHLRKSRTASPPPSHDVILEEADRQASQNQLAREPVGGLVEDGDSYTDWNGR